MLVITRFSHHGVKISQCCNGIYTERDSKGDF